MFLGWSAFQEMLKLNPMRARVILAMLIATKICSASIVVFAFGKKTAIIAADSRETYSDGTFKDTACKIGSYGSITWKDHAAAILQSQGAEQLLKMTKLNGSPQLAAFMFASTETATISIWYATVILTKIENGLPVLETKADEYGVDDESEFKLRALGHDQIFWEYVGAKTDRARLWRKDVEGSRSPPDRKVEETVTRLVELTINHDSEGVGGSVDRLRLEVGRGIQWLQRKPECSPSGERVALPDLKAPAQPKQ
jgi:hypothetical protein